MNIISQGTLFRREPGGAHSSHTFPGICVLPSGRWLASCRAAPTKSGIAQQQVLLCHSDDEGASWSSAVAPFTPPQVQGKAGLFRTGHATALGGDEVLMTLAWVDHSEPEIPFFNEQTQGLLDSEIFLAHSHDGGATWEQPRPLDSAPLEVPTPVTGPTLVLGNGEWACQFELNKNYYDQTEWRHASILMFSRDEGASWPEHSVVTSDPDNRVFYWDQRPTVLPDGRVLNLFWTYDNQTARYLNIHARESPDNGRCGSPLWDTGVPGQPAAPVALDDGRIALIYVDREALPTLKLRLSEDGAQTFPAQSERVLFALESGSQTRNKGSMEAAWAEMSAFSMGLPATEKLPNGDILLVFYAGADADQTEVKWMRLRAEE